MNRNYLIDELDNLTKQKERIKHGIERIENEDFNYIEDATLHGNNYILALGLIDEFSKEEFYSNVKGTIFKMLNEALLEVDGKIEVVKKYL